MKFLFSQLIEDDLYFMAQNPRQSPAQNACIYAINIDKDPVKSGVS